MLLERITELSEIGEFQTTVY